MSGVAGTTTGHDLKKNRSGYWEVRFSEQLGDGTWRSRSVSTGSKDRRAASVFKNEFLTNTARLAVVQGTPLVGEVLDHYERANPNQKFNLVAVRRELGSVTLDLLTPELVSDYIETRENDGVVSSTTRRELGALVAGLNWAVGKRTLGVKREHVPEIDMPPAGTPRNLWLDEDQEPLFHAWAMGLSLGRPTLHRLTMFIGLGLDTAARREALLDLTWDRVDMRQGQVDFRVPGRAVGNKRRTVVKISDRLMPLLERGRREWLAQGAPAGERVCGPGSIRSIWETHVVAGSAWPWMHAHLMRHSWAKLHARAGVSLFDIAAVLGDSYETVSRNYLFDCPGHGKVVNARWSLS
jgi:integrase